MWINIEGNKGIGTYKDGKMHGQYVKTYGDNRKPITLNYDLGVLIKK
jgi:hypothetical protein